MTAAIRPHDLARAEIDSWRGRCLDLFAKGERAIGQTLEAATVAPTAAVSVKLRHLAGQRADDLAAFLDIAKLSAKLASGAKAALANWRTYEDRRNSLAHAVLTATVDQRGSWFAIFDMTVYRTGKPHFTRWVVARGEAEAFVEELESSWKTLSGLLGHIRSKAGLA